MRCLESAEFGASVLIGRETGHRTCANGLPATPSSSRMLGRFYRLLALDHPVLCQYIELMRSTSVENGVIIISEHYGVSAADEVSKRGRLDLDQILCIARDVLSAASYLHERQLAIGYFSLNSILLPSNDQVRLSQYGLYYVSGGGTDVLHCIGLPAYISPERLMLRNGSGLSSRKSDIWAIGIALLEMIMGVMLYNVWGLKQMIAVIRNCIKKAVNGSALQPLLAALHINRVDVSFVQHSDLYILLEQMLIIRPSGRPKAKDLLEMLKKVNVNESNRISADNDTVPCILSAPTKLQGNDFRSARSSTKHSRTIIERRPLDEVFYSWKLSGCSVESILMNHGILKARAPLNTLPLVVVEECAMFGNESSRKHKRNLDVFALPSNNLRERFKSVDPEKFTMSFQLGRCEGDHVNLPAVVKERDIEYQTQRMIILSRLIKASPYKRHRLLDECGVDVPPLHRGLIWACFLNGHIDLAQTFPVIDTFTEQTADRQLMVDIPRCHQYDELMASPSARSMMKRLLKTWLLSHKQYVYWQGLDSLAAPFLLLHFNNLPVAYFCLSSFTSLYLKNFFLKDNSEVIQEYLVVFNHLLAFVDAHLYSHLLHMEFSPELFAIPWFLTCFAHVLPLHKLFHVWDAVLLSDSSFPLFIGLSIMEQLRPRLISASFNDAILLFSDLPDLNIEQVVQASYFFYKAIPSSCTFRCHASSHVRKVHKMERLSVSQLKEFSCPRISADDLISLIDCDAVLVIDVRATNEFARGSVIGSINIPPVTEGTTFDFIRSLIDDANESVKAVVIVGCINVQRAIKVASFYVINGVNKVCVLDGGIDSVKSIQRLITIPS
ncbi:hypothetical protein AB6A40_005585 [Gnathostoma spinigerum]|uniref:TBC domain-containing protein kinase-like protein n=1 Tax=Gnathostoma spinigerum TaxID=75299 RepID=A0ABD6EGP3_9BILA